MRGNNMERCYFDLECKVYTIYEPLREGGGSVQYCVHKEKVDNIIKDALKRHKIEYYDIDYDMAMTNSVCQIYVAPNTNDYHMRGALQEIVNKIADGWKEYTTLGDEI